MKAEDIKWCPQHGYPLPCYKCGMPLSGVDQKEIYKAGYDKAMAQLAEMTEECKQLGRREVVEWLGGWYDVDGYSLVERLIIPWAQWQAKLKEWGIDNANK